MDKGEGSRAEKVELCQKGAGSAQRQAIPLYFQLLYLDRQSLEV